MIGKMFFSLLIIFSSIVLITCGSSRTGNPYKTTKFPEGKNLYISKCMGCHKAYDPVSFTTEKWSAILDEMSIKAKLTSKEKEMILKYLTEKN